MSTVTQVLLTPPLQLAAVDSMYYTTPGQTTTKVGRAVFCNTDTVPHALTINVTSSTSSAANQIINPQSCILAAGQTYVSPELAGLVLPAGYMIRGLTDVAAKVTLVISGITIVGA